MGQAPLVRSRNSEATVNEKIIRPAEDRRIIHGNDGSHLTMGFKLRNSSYLGGQHYYGRAHENAFAGIGANGGDMCISTWVAIGALIIAAASLVSLWKSRRGDDVAVRQDGPGGLAG